MRPFDSRAPTCKTRPGASGIRSRGRTRPPLIPGSLRAACNGAPPLAPLFPTHIGLRSRGFTSTIKPVFRGERWEAICRYAERAWTKCSAASRAARRGLMANF